jgi:hypothetical protein
MFLKKMLAGMSKQTNKTAETKLNRGIAEQKSPYIYRLGILAP